MAANEPSTGDTRRKIDERAAETSLPELKQEEQAPTLNRNHQNPRIPPKPSTTERRGTSSHFHTFTTHVKGRWINRPLLEVLAHEFRTRPASYYAAGIAAGAILLNNARTSPTRILATGDTIRHTVHAHEPIPPHIPVIHADNDFLVAHKPAGIPVHPTGGYFRFSVTEALHAQRPAKASEEASLGCVNRLDLPVSGVLILAFKNHAAVHALLDSATKTYVACVAGEFPSAVSVDQPILCREGREHLVGDGGKPSLTHFKRLAVKDGLSLVECQPVTGRTHQIRLHLKYLGFPIQGDILYGGAERPSAEEGSEGTGRSGCNGDASQSALQRAGCGTEVTDEMAEALGVERAALEWAVSQCPGEENRTFKQAGTHICLHAWKYRFSGRIFEAAWPSWARAFSYDGGIADKSYECGDASSALI